MEDDAEGLVHQAGGAGLIGNCWRGHKMGGSNLGISGGRGRPHSVKGRPVSKLSRSVSALAANALA